MTQFTTSELALGNGKTNANVWVGYKGKVYDVSSSPLFQNGKHYSVSAGKDLTDEMVNAPHLEDVLDKFQVIGTLIADEVNDVCEEYHTQILEIVCLTDKVVEIVFERPTNYLFYSGQCFSLTSPNTKIKYDSSFYATSVAQNLSFIIQKDKVNYLFNNLKVGEKLYFGKSHGDFCLPVQITTDVLFVVQGMGVSPVHSMILDILGNRRTYLRVTLLYEFDASLSMIGEEEYKDLKIKYPNFSFVCTTDVKEAFSKYLSPSTQAYISGCRDFVDEVQALCSVQLDNSLIKTKIFQ